MSSFLFIQTIKNTKLLSQTYLETVWNAQYEREEGQYRHQRRPSPEELQKTGGQRTQQGLPNHRQMQHLRDSVKNSITYTIVYCGEKLHNDPLYCSIFL